ncbi:hypothetical protein OAO18_03840 [Francisellaceae bacterium]|nr:hypothetical protein [Francisellaceae bacterium]
MPADIQKGKISAAFIKRYSSSDGTCKMQSPRVGYSNIVAFSREDLENNSSKLHYLSFTSTGLNMTPVVIFNPKLEAISMYTGYRQGDKGIETHSYYLAEDPTDLSDPTDAQGYNKQVYVNQNDILELY